MTCNNKRNFKVYTKTGDKGMTSLFTGERKPKDDITFQCLGNVDELTSMIGVTKIFVREAGDFGVCEQLEKIQCLLQDLNSNVSTPRSNCSSEAKLIRTEFDSNSISELEKWIDKMDESLDELSNFILPGATKASSFLHLSRTIARRAERSIIPLSRDNQDVDPNCAIYLNRLSDYLFTAARYLCKKEDSKDFIYKKH